LLTVRVKPEPEEAKVKEVGPEIVQAVADRHPCVQEQQA
jgi:hypothetical protein